MEFLPAPNPPNQPVEELHVWSIDLGWESPRRRRAAANSALRQVLATYLGRTPREIDLMAGRHGKPYLAGPEGRLEFNLSHSDEIALVALTLEHPVGVDVEKVRPGRDAVALAERALDQDDVSAVRAATSETRDLVFHRCWARHEARLKCLGVGIFRVTPPPQAATVAVQDLEIAPGYTAAVAVQAPQVPPLRRWTFDPNSLQKDGNRVS